MLPNDFTSRHTKNNSTYTHSFLDSPLNTATSSFFAPPPSTSDLLNWNPATTPLPLCQLPTTPNLPVLHCPGSTGVSLALGRLGNVRSQAMAFSVSHQTNKTALDHRSET